MGEVIAALVVLVVVVLIGGAGLMVVVSQREQRLRRTPTPVLGGDDASYRLKATANYKTAQSAVRLLEEIVARDETVPILSREESAKAKAIIDHYYEEN